MKPRKFLTQNKLDKLQALIDDNNGVIDEDDLIPLLKSYKKQLLIQRVINWVDVKKELPTQTGEVLIYVDGLGVRNAVFNVNDNSFSFNSIYKPMHWAELPKPPCL